MSFGVVFPATSNVQPGEVNMEQLVGNTEEFADSGYDDLTHVLSTILIGVPVWHPLSSSGI
jgi:hypothetical protein